MLDPFLILFWLYQVNATTLIVHEIDPAYWKEWDLFRLPGGEPGFLLLHFPLLAAVLHGLALVERRAFSGLVFSILVSAAGVSAFTIHLFFIHRGRQEFNTIPSRGILWATLFNSLAQMSLALAIWRALLY